MAQGTTWANARISWPQDKCSVSPIVLAVRGFPGGAVNTMLFSSPSSSPSLLVQPAAQQLCTKTFWGWLV